MELGNWKSSSALPDGQARAVLTVANGLTSKEGGRLFGVSPNTINAALNQLREKLNGNYGLTGKRSWIVTEAIRKGWLSPLTVFLFIGSIVTGLFSPSLYKSDMEDLGFALTEIPDAPYKQEGGEKRRRSNRLTGSRMVRGRRTREAIDFEFEDMTPELLSAFLDSHSDTNTLAPWSSVVMNKDVPLTNEMRLELWRDLFNTQVQLA